MTHDYLSRQVQNSIPVQSQSRPNTRHVNNIPSILCKTNNYYNYFLSTVIRDWNSLPAEIQNSSISNFKNFIDREINKPPTLYYDGTRLGQILHTRLRLKCSSLKEHLFNKKNIGRPSMSMWGNRK